MTSNIIAIRAAQAQLPQLREQLREQQEEALADGVIDADEQAEIDDIERLIDAAERLVETRMLAWEANKAAYDRLRSDLGTDLNAVSGSDNAALAQDQKAVSDAATRADNTAATEDYAAALALGQTLKRLVDLFLQRLENERLSAFSPEELAEMSLADEDLEVVFTEEYMRELAVMTFAGEGTRALKDVIIEIEKAPTGARRAEVMADLAKVVGEPPSAAELDADYGRYLILCKQRDEIAKQTGQDEPEAVDEDLHPDFVGSHEQLMFGKVLGDALGIHEVFATLLSPTGGLVGPGNMLIPENDFVDSRPSPHLAPNNPVALHGTVHDAAGYLDSFHNEGPGYNYRGSEIEALITDGLKFVGLDALLPLTGQASGIYFWANEEDGREFIEALYDEKVVELEKALEGVRADATDEIDKILFAFEEAKQDALDKAEAIRDDLEDRVEQAEQDVIDFAEEVEAEALEALEAFEDGVERVSDTVVEKYEALSDDARAMGEGVMDKIGSVANYIWNSL